MKFTPAAPPGTSPEDTRPACGSPPLGDSILMTSAPHSASTAPEIGTNVQAATSTTRIPASTSFNGAILETGVLAVAERVVLGYGNADYRCPHNHHRNTRGRPDHVARRAV